MLFLRALHRETLREDTAARELSPYKLQLQRKTRVASHSITTSGRWRRGEEESTGRKRGETRLEIIKDYNDHSMVALIFLRDHERPEAIFSVHLE